MPVGKSGTVLEKLRANLGRAESALKRAQTRHDDLKARVKTANPTWASELERKLWLARLELNDAEANATNARQALATEEHRLMQPDTFLRFV